VRKGDDDHAIADFSEAIRLDRYFTDAYYSRGEAYRRKGDPRADADLIKRYPAPPLSVMLKRDSTLAAYDHAIRRNPKDAAALYNRGNAHRSAGRGDPAIADYNEAIRLNQAHASVYYYRGILYEEKGELDLAIADYGQALKLNPELEPVQRALERAQAAHAARR
jgi:tetratricopeptide (TPR) repeat protein